MESIRTPTEVDSDSRKTDGGGLVPPEVFVVTSFDNDRTLRRHLYAERSLDGIAACENGLNVTQGYSLSI